MTEAQMPQYQTPGVYIAEKNALPNSVVAVATAVPAFLGYTEKCEEGSRSLLGVPTRISSMSEFETFFGGAPRRKFVRRQSPGGTFAYSPAGQDFYLFNALRHYFDNDGGPCWIVSVGLYDAASHTAADFSDAVWVAIANEQEPAIYVVPDAVALAKDDYKAISERSLGECQRLADRVAILDIYDGANPRIDQVIGGDAGFRNFLSFGEKPSYGMAYYPWLVTSLLSSAEVDFTWLDDPSRLALADEIKAEPGAGDAALAQRIGKIAATPPDATDAKVTHEALMQASPCYRQAMDGLRQAANVLPPSGAMAAIFARTDSNIGVFGPPANTSLASVIAPAVTIDHVQQEDLNVPLDGHAVNAIRSFIGRGVLVWGARTLDGNSQDYRYINVRRTLIMLEQSIALALQAYVFAPNDSGTWVAVKSMIENFLVSQWKAGALMGAGPDDAFAVHVGLGSTMTSQDILDGILRVTVQVAVVRPAEFIVITFQQQMQTS
jgi:phage tail sheath protein FI